MINYIGFELNTAAEALKNEGFTIVVCEVRSKKGICEFDSKRVVRQKMIDEQTVELCYSCVMTFAKGSKE